MELYETQGNFIILNGENSLWCNREDGGLLAKHGAYIYYTGDVVFPQGSRRCRFAFWVRVPGDSCQC